MTVSRLAEKTPGQRCRGAASFFDVAGSRLSSTTALSAGRYAVAAVGYPGNVTIWYPESVDVGYSQVLTGIDLEFDPEAVEKSFQPQAPSHKLAAIVVRSLPQGAVAFDAMGRKAVNPKSGVYFVRDVDRGAGDAGRTRKVVIQN